MNSFFDPQEIWKKERENRALAKLNNSTQSPKREPFSLREGLDTFSREGANVFKAPSDSPFLRSMAPQDRPNMFVDQPKVNLNRAADTMLYGGGEKQIGGNWDQLKTKESSRGLSQITATDPNGGTIGGMSVNSTPYDDQVRASMEAINNKLASMPIEDVSPDQINKIQKLRRQAGYLRGGTDRQRVGPDGLPLRNQGSISSNQLQQLGNGLDVTFDESIPQANRQAFINNSSGEMSAKESFNRNLAHQQWLDRQGYTKVNEQNPWEKIINSNMSPGRKIDAMRAMEAGKANQESNALLKDKNRIDEMNIRSQNTLRDIQGQLAQNPPTKSNEYKPQVITEEDILGNKTQRIMVPDANGQYINGMENQGFETPSEATKARMLSKKGSKDAAAYEAEYIKRFGSLPY